jgi:hypothetical protein
MIVTAWVPHNVSVYLCIVKALLHNFETFLQKGRFIIEEICVFQIIFV